MAVDKASVRKILDKVKAEGRTSLTAPEGKLVCDAYGITVPKEGVATSAAEAAKLASAMGFPVVLKIVSPTILHKTEAGGVLVGVKTKEDVERGFATIMDNATPFIESALRTGSARSRRAALTADRRARARLAPGRRSRRTR